MSFPIAVAPSVRTAGLALLVNLLAGTSSPGTAALRGCLIATKDSTAGNVGTITPDTELKQAVAGADDVGGFLGFGTPGHLAAKAIFAEYALATLDLAAPVEAAGVAASQTVTFDATVAVTVSQTVTIDIAGREIQIVWAPGESAIVAATRLVAAINAATRDLPVRAANGGGALAVVTITAKLKGTWGNDILLYLTVADGTGGAVTLGAAALAAGTTEPSLVNVLALISGTEYDFIQWACGNTDAGAASATSGPGRVKTHIDGLDAGFSAKLQQCVIGATGAIATVKAGAAQHLSPALEYVFCLAGRSLPAEFGGAEMGRRLRMEAIDPAVNAIDTLYQASLYGARDLTSDSLTEAEHEDLLQSGVTPVSYTFNGSPRVSRPITTYFRDTNGLADDRCLDVSGVSGTYAVAKDLRLALPQAFPNVKLAADAASGEEEIPEGVVEVKDVKAFVISRLRYWQKRGVVRRDKLDEAIASGTLIVRVNPTDESQCDLVVPLAIFKPLAKFSLVVQKVA